MANLCGPRLSGEVAIVLLQIFAPKTQEEQRVLFDLRSENAQLRREFRGDVGEGSFPWPKNALDRPSFGEMVGLEMGKLRLYDHWMGFHGKDFGPPDKKNPIVT